MGEIRRVLNSFLQMIESDQSHSLIVAATNHVEILDYALFRRFDDVIEYRFPGAPQAARLIQSRREVRAQTFSTQGAYKQSGGFELRRD